MPRWTVVAMGLRQLLAPLIGVPRAPTNVFAVTKVDRANGLVRVVTAVRLKGWRGRLYFAPVRLAHPIVVHSMLKRTQKVLAAA